MVANALRELVALRAVLDSLEKGLVVRARLDGATWLDLAAPLGVSKQGVRKRHLSHDPVFSRRSAKPQTIDEYHAEMAAFMRARGITL